MIRKPLRPIAEVLKAREDGLDPAFIEYRARAERLREQRKAERRRAEYRLVVLALFFLAAFASVGWKMSELATNAPAEAEVAASRPGIVNQRANIVDRNGSILATNLITKSLFAHPQEMVDPQAAADGLVRIFPDLDRDYLLRSFGGKRKFVWIKHKLSPEQQQAVHDLGEPGLQFGPRETRLYPNGNLAAHILGGTKFGEEGVHAAEIVGTAGIELTFDDFLRDPAQNGAPLELSIDVSVQSAMRRVLASGMWLMNARGAAAVLMEADTGQVISLVSLPDFDPNHRPTPPVLGDPADSPLFNRVAQGKYELGSTFKLFTAALAMERGIAGPDTMIPTRGPLVWGKYRINDFHNYGAKLSLMDVIVKSSNIGTANLAKDIGTEPQQEFLKALGFFEPTSLEVTEARRSKPLLPLRWSDLSTMTVSYGHGLAATPLHLAAAYATISNGGLKVTPTLLKNMPAPTEADRVISENTSAVIRKMLRQVVVRGTATLGEVEGYQVGGKTGTADKPKPTGGYYDDKVITTFASVFPASDPKYVLVVTLDEPEETSGTEDRRTAGWTAVPVGAEIIRRIAPLMGMRPQWHDEPLAATTASLTLTTE